jgi:peptidoglycan-associated lipoprotein
MHRGSFFKHLIVSLSALILAIGCASTSTKTTDLGKDGSGSGSDDPYVDSRNIDDGSPEARAELDKIYFDYDRSLVRDDMKDALRSNAEKILENEGWGAIIVEGHCDERGSEEYNFALGERRAATVKKYLVALGVPSNRLETVSFGETQPVAGGHDESSWGRNRRAEFRSASN